MSNNMLVILFRRSFLDHLYASPVSVRYKLDKKTLVQSTLTSKGIKNIARIANAVQVTICLLVSTSVY